MISEVFFQNSLTGAKQTVILTTIYFENNLFPFVYILLNS